MKKVICFALFAISAFAQPQLVKTGVYSILMTNNGGSGCVNPAATIDAPSAGTTATATVSVSGGVVAGTIITQPGYGYTTVPNVAFTQGSCASIPLGTVIMTGAQNYSNLIDFSAPSTLVNVPWLSPQGFTASTLGARLDAACAAVPSTSVKNTVIIPGNQVSGNSTAGTQTNCGIFDLRGGNFGFYGFGNVNGVSIQPQVTGTAPIITSAVATADANADLKLTANGSGVVSVPNAVYSVEVAAAAATVAAVHGPTGLVLVPAVAGHTLKIVNVAVQAIGGATATCTSINIGDSTGAGIQWTATAAALTQNTVIGLTAPAAGTLTLWAGGFGTAETTGRGIAIFDAGSQCTTATGFNVWVQYKVN